MGLGRGEGLLQVDVVRVVGQPLHVHQLGLNVVNDSVKGEAISPAGPKVLHRHAETPGKERKGKTSGIEPLVV